MADHYFSNNQTSQLRITEFEVEFFGKSFTLKSASGVFSIGKIDRGTEILLKYAEFDEDNENQKILDLGCGYGIVGISLSYRFPYSEIIMSDVNKRALRIAKDNVRDNKRENIKVIRSDLFSKIDEEFDVILSNPPFSAGRGLCYDLIEQSYDRLKDNGTLQIVARKNKGGAMLSQKMEEVFGNVETLGKKSGFWVYMSRKVSE